MSANFRKIRRHQGIWPLISAAILALALVVLVSAGNATRASADDVAGDPTTTVEEHFASTGYQQVIYFDRNVTNFDVTAIGAFGANAGSRLGGVGAKVEARLPVGFNYKYWVLVGGNGHEDDPGFNGGGSGSRPSWTTAWGGGGGGATDLRTVNADYLDSIGSRVLVAAGGGGAGGAPLRTGRLGGIGGNAGAAGAQGENATPENTIGSGGYGGKAGATLTGGGAGGGGGFMYFPNAGVNGSDGAAGKFGSGGNGGAGAFNSGAGMGAGGGGGFFGGGGGGGGMFWADGQEYFSGAGGGGGGSSLIPEDNGSVSLASRDDVPSVEISYTVPGTTIVNGPGAVIAKRSAEFSFESSQPNSTFECRLGDDAEFAACESPIDFDALAEGRQLFEVRAVNDMGNFDGTPAKRSFTVDTSVPAVTITAEPAGKTRDRRPEFSFRSSEAGSTFQCRFDAEAFRACSGTNSDRPEADLSTGGHSFSVKATDQAGNTGPAATRNFDVEASDPTPPPPGEASLRLKRPKLNKKNGIAKLPARVSAAGRVILLKSRVVRSSKKHPKGASTVKLKVRARGKALKKLRRRGKVKLKVRVKFIPESGGKITKSKRVTLRKKVRRR